VAGSFLAKTAGLILAPARANYYPLSSFGISGRDEDAADVIGNRSWRTMAAAAAINLQKAVIIDNGG